MKQLELTVVLNEDGTINLRVPPQLPLPYVLGLLELAKDIVINDAVQEDDEEEEDQGNTNPPEDTTQ